MITRNQKRVLSVLVQKTYWLREDAEVKCIGIYSTTEELIRGFGIMSNNGLLCLNRDVHYKIIGLWVTDTGIKTAKQFTPERKNQFEVPCGVPMKICYHAGKCCSSYKCNAARATQ